MSKTATLGEVFDFYVTEYELPRKAIAEATGIHPSSLSRFASNGREFSPQQVARIFITVGKLASAKRA